MAGQAVNLSGQINNLANSILQPATLSQTQQGLLGQLHRQVNPVPEIDMSTQDGLRAGIQDAIKRGDADRATMLQKVLTQKMGDERAMAVAETSADSRIAVADINASKAIAVQGMKDTTVRWKAAQDYIRDAYKEGQKNGRTAAMIDGRRDVQDMKIVAAQSAATLKYERELEKVDIKDVNTREQLGIKHQNELALIDEKAKKQLDVYRAQGKIKAEEAARKALLQSRLRRIEKAEDVTKNDLEILMGTIKADERFSAYMPTVAFKNLRTDKLNAKQSAFAKRLAVEVANYMRTANANIDHSDENAKPVNESEALEVILKRLQKRRADRAAARDK